MKILISGAGIAGLTLAARLQQRGFAPIVIERAPHRRAGGYMLSLADPGYDAAERMGVVDELHAVRHVPRRLVYMSPDGRERFALHDKALDRLVGGRQINLMRGDIEAVLYEKARGSLDIRFGSSIASLELQERGARVRLEGGDILDVDLVVGADGLHSRVRALAFGPEPDYVRPLGLRIAAFVLDRSEFSELAEDVTYSLTEVDRAMALAAIRGGGLVAFFVYRSAGARPGESMQQELCRAFAGAEWLVPRTLECLARAVSVYIDDVAQVVMPGWTQARAVLLGDAGYAVSLIAGRGASLAMAGACVLADAIADAGDPTTANVAAALARYERWLRPMVEQAQAMARRNVNLFTPASRFQLRARDMLLRVAGTPGLARLVRRALYREGQRLPPPGRAGEE